MIEPATSPENQPLIPQRKPWIEAIHAYVPGKSGSDNGKPVLKLSANENPNGCSPLAKAALAESASRNPAFYPDPESRALRERLAALHGLDADRIVCGTGSDELLNLAAQGYAGPGDEVIYMRYGFAVYDIAARRCGATPVVVPDRDYGTDADALIAAITPQTRVIFLANPNNPTGTLASAADIARIHAAIPADVLLVLDQAYAEYLTPEQRDDGIAMASKYDNVLVTRTFSKIYGLAGERIGWATGASHIIDTLNRIRGPFNVTLSGQAAAIAALADQNFVDQAARDNQQVRDWFNGEIASLSNHGLRAVPSAANFVLVLFEGQVQAGDAYAALADAGYIVRWLPGQGLGHGLRITMGSMEQMQGLMTALRAILADKA